MAAGSGSTTSRRGGVVCLALCRQGGCVETASCSGSSLRGCRRVDNVSETLCDVLDVAETAHVIILGHHKLNKIQQVDSMGSSEQNVKGLDLKSRENIAITSKDSGIAKLKVDKALDSLGSAFKVVNLIVVKQVLVLELDAVVHGIIHRRLSAGWSKVEVVVYYQSGRAGTGSTTGGGSTSARASP